MNKKNIVRIAIVLLVVALTIVFILNRPDRNNENASINSQGEQYEQKPLINKKIHKDAVYDSNNKYDLNDNDKKTSAIINKSDEFIKKANFFNSDAGVDVPLSTISDVSSLPQNIQDKVYSIAKTNNIFMTKRLNDRLLIIAENPDNIRHCIEFIEISLKNGHQVTTTLGYNDKIKDSDNDIWEYDETTKQPTRHSKYNSDGDVEFVEIWNYGDNPVKYEMKDSDGHVLSMRKETIDGGTDLRIEHLLYDKSGNTKINVSTMYDGADVKRFMYYNADKPLDGGSVFAEYVDGLKTKETVYSNDLKVVNSYTSLYKNGDRTEITVYDNNNNEIEKLVPSYASDDL